MSDLNAEWIIETTTENFRQDVIEQSMERPVVVDFWAPWCNPCKQLIPMLEKLANEFAGRFVLVKVNVDDCPEVAGAFGVQSIPFVVAMVNGQPASHFQGIQPEPQLKAWIESFVPSASAEAFDQGQQLEADGATELAEAAYRNAVQADPDKAAYKIAHARVLLALDRQQECREILDELNARGFLEPEAQALQQQLELRSQVEDSGGVQEARSALESNPDDLSLQIKLAEALGADNRFEEACEMCLAIIGKDKGDIGTKAKEVMVGILGVMGPKSKLASELRRRLATAFY
ncbi:MAG: tetratricopeptide repeat protein [Planctomycetaceae bacterium]|nr:tetratricopeptide repeat protein [Planctomycetaceae bacterium]